jgi:hypothetical protein
VGAEAARGRGLALKATATNPARLRAQLAFAATWTAEAAFTVAIGRAYESRRPCHKASNYSQGARGRGSLAPIIFQVASWHHSSRSLADRPGPCYHSCYQIERIGQK